MMNQGDRPLYQQIVEWVRQEINEGRLAATWLASQNVPPHVLSALLNHSPGSAMGVTAIYNRFRYLDERRAALELWAKHVTGLADQKRIAKGA